MQSQRFAPSHTACKPCQVYRLVQMNLRQKSTGQQRIYDELEMRRRKRSDVRIIAKCDFILLDAISFCSHPRKSRSTCHGALAVPVKPAMKRGTTAFCHCCLAPHKPRSRRHGSLQGDFRSKSVNHPQRRAWTLKPVIIRTRVKSGMAHVKANGRRIGGLRGAKEIASGSINRWVLCIPFINLFWMVSTIKQG